MTLPGEYFDRMYAQDPDPWGFSTRWYEERKYSLTLAMLPQQRYRRAFEPGCSIGILTGALAARCEALVASDPSAAALKSARARVPDNVELREGAIPRDWPDGTFDLIVLSEIAYYLSADDLEQLIARMRSSLAANGNLVAVHWRPKVPQYPSDGHAVHMRFTETFRPLAHYEDQYALLDVLGGSDAVLTPPE